MAQTAPQQMPPSSPTLPTDAEFDQQQAIVASLKAQMDKLDQQIASAKAQGMKVPADLTAQRQQVEAASTMLSALQARAGQVRQMSGPQNASAPAASVMGATLPSGR